MNSLHTVAPAISCFALTQEQADRRVDAAKDYVEQLCLRNDKPVEKASTSGYARETMWHPAFAAEYVALISKMSLYEVALWGNGLAGWANNNKPLDLLDYCYLADVLREGLADNPTPLAALRLGRALAWVEQAGTKLLPTQAAMLAPASETPMPHLAAA
jgi:hypothetical protein